MSTAVRRDYGAAAVVIPSCNEREKLSAWHVGGFRCVATGEKAELVERFEAAGHRIHRDTDLSVITSKRIPTWAHGFADYLTQLGRTAAGDCA